MSDKPVLSIYDLAKRTGVSTSTVSRVLNQRGRISFATRQKVLTAAREAGFKPRMSARQTAVAVVLDRMRYTTYGGFVSSVLTHLVDEFSRHDVAVEVYTENNVERLGSRFIDAVVGMSWDQATLQQLRQLRDVPVVLVNRMDLPEFSFAATDHHHGGRLVADYLIGRGHRRIAFLAEESDWGAQERLRGIRDSLGAAGDALRDELVAFTEHQPVYGALRRVLAHRPTAIFLAGEDLALEASYVLTDVLGVSVPDHVSVVGIENHKVSQFTRPPLTALRQPLDRLAAEALRLVMEHIEGRTSEPTRAVLANDLIERESVGPPSA
jgi:DNA-binding LacI/PurR family transcriptional regulator